VEYLVTMTTSVPAGTPDEAVEDIRTREAAHAGELAADGYLQRLWRPPLRADEWRTIGLFSADTGTELEQVLASMPLHIWRTDEVTPLSPHPHDPMPGQVAVRHDRTEFLSTLLVAFPRNTSSEQIGEFYDAEGLRSRELAEQGTLLRLWRLPGERRSLSHWQAHDAEQLAEVMTSLPLAPWLTAETVRVTRHPNDPAVATSDEVARPRQKVGSPQR
jgi:muconolactone delta-isomerase